MIDLIWSEKYLLQVTKLTIALRYGDHPCVTVTGNNLMKLYSRNNTY